MCRSIRVLRTADPATPDDVRAAARQFVRKVSGFREDVPSRRHGPFGPRAGERARPDRFPVIHGRATTAAHQSDGVASTTSVNPYSSPLEGWRARPLGGDFAPFVRRL